MAVGEVAALDYAVYGSCGLVDQADNLRPGVPTLDLHAGCHAGQVNEIAGAIFPRQDTAELSATRRS